MQLTRSVLALSVITAFLPAQNPDGSSARAPAEDPRILLEYAQFDPSVSVPRVPLSLQASASVNLHIVQFKSTPTDDDRAAIERAGGVIKGYLPHDCHIVYMAGGANALYSVEQVRWIGPYEPAYRIEPYLLNEHVRGAAVPTRTYNMVMVDKLKDKQKLAEKITALGGEIVDMHIGGLLFTARMTGQQMIQAAGLDEVLWIDRDSAIELDMDNARVQGGADAIEASGGYTGSGIRGHVYEGVEFDHVDFSTAMTPVQSSNAAQSHGHCTAGIVFGNGTSAAQARGMAPDAVGFFTNYSTVTSGYSRNAVIDEVVNIHNCMFTTASWGNARTFLYTSVSADADDIVFDHRIPWTQSQSNAGNQDSRPQAWAKNVISVGGAKHYNNSLAADDSWDGGGSTGPAQDGRQKPDLAAYYDSVWTSDRTGASGYSSGDSTTGFNGTSAATPILAGHNALAIQMYTDHLFTEPRVQGGSRFENRPMAQTLKALQIACANMYTPTATDNRREHVGYGFPSLSNMHDRQHKISIIPEDAPITQGTTHTYEFEVDPGESTLKICMTYLDPAGNPAASFDRINDLDLRVTSPTGTQYWGNWGLDGTFQSNQSTFGGLRDSRDTVECVIRSNPTAGVWTVEISAPTVTQDANVATTATDAVYAVVVNGGRRIYGSGCAEFLPDASTTYGNGNYYPWGGYTPTALETVYASNNSGSVGGAVYFDVVASSPIWVHSLQINTSLTAGAVASLDLHTRSGSFAGEELNPNSWTPRSAGRGVSAGLDAATQIDLAQPFRLAAGTHGFAISANNFEHRYTNGTNSYTSGSVSINTGTASNVPFTGSLFSPRTANVTVKFRDATAQAQNMRYQTIMRSDELGAADAITGLAFSGQSNGRHFNETLQIRMSHIAAGSTLSTTFSNNLPSSTTVLDSTNYSWDYADGEWRNVGLQTPFAYNGTDDVVIDIVATGNVQTSTGSGTGPFERDANRSRIYSANWDTTTPTTGSSASTSALRMRVEFSCANANEFGATCGKLTASHSGSSVLGSALNFHVHEAMPNFVAFLGLGENNSAPYPMSLTALGFTNCTAFSQSLIFLSVPTNAVGEASYALSIPISTVYSGYQLSAQWIGIDTSEPGNLTWSDVTRMTAGSNP